MKKKRKRKNSEIKNTKRIKYNVPDTLILETSHKYLDCFVEYNELNVFVIHNFKLLKFYSFNNHKTPPWVMKSFSKKILLEIPKNYKLPKLFCKSNFTYVINNSINVYNFKENKHKKIDVKRKIKEYCFYSDTMVVCTSDKYIRFYKDNKIIKKIIPFLREEDQLVQSLVDPCYTKVRFLKYICVQCFKNKECSVKEEHIISHDNFILIGSKTKLQIFNVKQQKLYPIVDLRKKFRILTINNTNLYLADNKSIIDFKIKSQNSRKSFYENKIKFGVYYNESFFYVNKQNVFGGINLINKENILEREIEKRVKDLKIFNQKIFIVV